MVYCDGKEQNLLNMGDFVVTHELMRDYLKLYLGDGYVDVSTLSFGGGLH